MDPFSPSSIPSRIVVAAPSSDHPTSHIGCPSAEEIPVDVCKALRLVSPILVRARGTAWQRLGAATTCHSSRSPQQFEFEARHFRDLATKSYVTHCAQIVVYYWWAAQTAVSADWDTMGVVWVVRDSLWNASCASPQRRPQLVGLWADRTSEASSIDMSFAPPLIAVQVYNMGNSHWVLCLLLIAPTR